MVQQFHHRDGGWRFVLRPNRSATWAQSKRFLAIVATACLGVAGAFASVGYWPVLPFAGAEVALLTFALWWTSHRTARTEVVDIDSETVDVEKGREEPEQRWSFQRAWARVSLVPARVPQHPSRLLPRRRSSSQVTNRNFLTSSRSATGTKPNRRCRFSTRQRSSPRQTTRQRTGSPSPTSSCPRTASKRHRRTSP